VYGAAVAEWNRPWAATRCIIAAGVPGFDRELPRVVDALLVVAMTVGFIATDLILTR
jgi:hypothetical protein